MFLGEANSQLSTEISTFLLECLCLHGGVATDKLNDIRRCTEIPCEFARFTPFAQFFGLQVGRASVDK